MLESQDNDILKRIEENRKRNKELMEQSMAEFYKEFPEMKEELQKNKEGIKRESQKVITRRKTLDPAFYVAGVKRRQTKSDMTPTRRSSRLAKTEGGGFNLSNNENNVSSNEDDTDNEDGSKPKKRRRHSDQQLAELKTPRRSYVAGSRATQVPEIPVEEVNDRLIAKIARSSKKVYDSIKGTTCHQCRQKTTDTKSVCRSGSCVGVRGMFCGVCLKNRYGEDVAEVLKDPNWSCPPCRGDCNCSICRTRLGKMPTGIMVPFIREQGYSHLREYLNKNPDDDE